MEIPRPPAANARPASPPQRATVLICVSDADWATRLHRSLAVEPNFTAQLVGAKEVERVAAASLPGCLLLDVDLVGNAAKRILQAWWGGERHRGPVLLVGASPEHEGVVTARTLGAQAYVRTGKGADMVVAQMRYQIQRAGAGPTGAKK